MAIFKHAALLGALYAGGEAAGLDMWWATPVGQVPQGRIFGQNIIVPVPPVMQAGVNLVASAWMQLGEPFRKKDPDLNLFVQLAKATFTSMRFNQIEMDNPTKAFLGNDLPTLLIPGFQPLKRVYKVARGQKSPLSLFLPTKRKESTGSIYR